MFPDSLEDMFLPPLPDDSSEIYDESSHSHLHQQHFLPQSSLARDTIYPSQYQSPSALQDSSFDQYSGSQHIHNEEKGHPFSSHQRSFVDAPQLVFQHPESNEYPELSQGRPPFIAPPGSTHFNPDGTFRDSSFDHNNWDIFQPQLADLFHTVHPVNFIEGSIDQAMLRNDSFEFWPPRTTPDASTLPQTPSVHNRQVPPFTMSAIQFLDPINGSSTEVSSTNLPPSLNRPPSQLHSTDSVVPELPVDESLPPRPTPRHSSIRGVTKRKGNNPHGCKSILRCQSCRKQNSKVRTILAYTNGAYSAFTIMMIPRSLASDASGVGTHMLRASRCMVV